MDSSEIKLRCLDIAVGVCRAHANFNETDIVDIATKFYNYVSACDKPDVKSKASGKKDNQADIFT